ncbi:putative conserved TM protein [Vairimorpha necatrix]|uniref:Conserved TM protein n=1 Tax=Vairimorpha necatrix TaxID=6039 RepID=A0AAX4JAR4_9MICR
MKNSVQKKLIQQKEKFGLLITIIQQIFITCLFSKIVNSHVKILFNPFSLVQILFKKSTFIFMLSFLIPILLKFYSRSKHINFMCLLFGYTFSSLIFYINFPVKTNILEMADNNIVFIFKKILINLNFTITCVVSLISGLILSFDIRNNILEFAEIEGIFKYYALSTKRMINRILNMWFVNLIFSCGFLISYVLFISFFVNILLMFLRCDLVYNGRIINHMILLYISVLIHLSMTEFFNRLLIYNLSIKDKKFTNFIKDNDLNYVRYVFYRVSNMSYKYNYVLNQICRNKQDLCDLLEYVEKECDNVKNICKNILEEYKILDNKLYMTVPQIKPNGSMLVKKYKNYNFIDKWTSKIIYKLKIYMLKNDFNNSVKYMENINKYINFLLKQRDQFMLLVDLDKRYTYIYKDLIDEIRQVEEQCNIDLKVLI